MTREEHKQAAQTFYEAFPDFRHTIEEVIAEGDKVVIRATDQGTHKGEFQGISPTGHEIGFGVIAIYRFANGEIAETWLEADFMGLMQQIGAIPS